MRLSVVDQGHIRSGQPGTIGIAALFAGDPPDLAQVRSRVGARWGRLERMSWVLGQPAGPAALSGHHWSPAGPFDPADHVVATAGEGLESVLTAGVSRPLPADRPLWRLVVAEDATPEGEHALVLFAHHGLLDGRSLESLVRLLTDDAVPPRPPVPAAPRPPAVPAALRKELRRLG
uniref:wax ester/triacylglycerol synthase domain-containing protein n=1 Tax=Streptomyces sp. CRN 30 TaxID=3075613 RepID=UPI002A837FC2